MYRIIAIDGKKSISIKADNFSVSYLDTLAKPDKFSIPNPQSFPAGMIKIITENGVIFLKREAIVKIERYTGKRKH